MLDQLPVRPLVTGPLAEVPLAEVPLAEVRRRLDLLSSGSGAVRRVEGFVDDLSRVHAVDRAVARNAAQLRAKFTALPLDQALVVATAEVTAAHEILTTNSTLADVDSRAHLIGAGDPQ